MHEKELTENKKNAQRRKSVEDIFMLKTQKLLSVSKYSDMYCLKFAQKKVGLNRNGLLCSMLDRVESRGRFRARGQWVNSCRPTPCPRGS